MGETESEKSTEKTEISPPRCTLKRAPPGTGGGPSQGSGPLPSGDNPCPWRGLELRGPPRVVRARAGLRLAAPPPGTCQEHQRAGNRAGGRRKRRSCEWRALAFFRLPPPLRTPSPGSLCSSPRLARSRGRELAQTSPPPPPPRASPRPSLSASRCALRSRHGDNLGLLRVAASQRRALRPKSPRAGYGLGRKRGQPRGNEKGRHVGSLKAKRPHDEFPQGGRSEQPVPEGSAHRYRAVLRGPGGVGEVLGHLPPGQGQPGRRQHR